MHQEILIMTKNSPKFGSVVNDNVATMLDAALIKHVRKMLKILVYPGRQLKSSSYKST